MNPLHLTADILPAWGGTFCSVPSDIKLLLNWQLSGNDLRRQLKFWRWRPNLCARQTAPLAQSYSNVWGAAGWLIPNSSCSDCSSVSGLGGNNGFTSGSTSSSHPQGWDWRVPEVVRLTWLQSSYDIIRAFLCSPGPTVQLLINVSFSKLNGTPV